MRITNRTNWDTGHLRRFIIETCERELLGPEFRKRIRATFTHTYKGHVSGYAYLHSHTFRIHMPRTAPDKAELASVLAHELAHCQGVKHGKSMTNSYGWEPGWRDKYLWADSLPLELKQQAPKPDRLIERLNHCQWMLHKWARKAELAKTKVAQWKRRANSAGASLAKAASPASPASLEARALAIGKEIVREAMQKAANKEWE